MCWQSKAFLCNPWSNNGCVGTVSSCASNHNKHLITRLLHHCKKEQVCLACFHCHCTVRWKEFSQLAMVGSMVTAPSLRIPHLRSLGDRTIAIRGGNLNIIKYICSYRKSSEHSHLFISNTFVFIKHKRQPITWTWQRKFRRMIKTSGGGTQVAFG